MAETKKEAPENEVPSPAWRSRVGMVTLVVGLVAAGVGASQMEKAHRGRGEAERQTREAGEAMRKAENLAAQAMLIMEEVKVAEERRKLADTMFPMPVSPFGVGGAEDAINVQMPPPPPRMSEILSSEELAEKERLAAMLTEDGLPKMRSPEAAKLLELAKLKESDQDTVGALKLLDDANTLEPDHPAILYQMGVVFDKLGKRERAVGLFQNVAAMEGRAGELATLSVHYLNGKDSVALPGGLNHRYLSIGPAFHDVLPDETGKRTVKLSLSIRAAAGKEIDPYEVRPEIYFYDLVNEDSVEACEGFQPPVEEVNPWRSEIPDYKEPNEELLDVVYHIPFIEDGVKREFFGYVVKLYYRDEVQDVLVEPRILVELLSKRDRGNESELDATLLGG